MIAVANPLATTSLHDLPPGPRGALWQTIRYVLGLYPVVAEVIRVPREPRDIAGFRAPAGTPIAACIAAVHADPRVYAEPNLFRPERFVGRRFAAYEFAPSAAGAVAVPGPNWRFWR
jgi:cytochrome P450